MCTLKPFDESAALKRSYLLKNSAVVVNSKDYSERIIKQLEIEKLDKIIGNDKSAYIGGKEIKLMVKQVMDEHVVYQKKWSELIMEKWAKFESSNFCVYVLVWCVCSVIIATYYISIWEWAAASIRVVGGPSEPGAAMWYH